MSDQRFALVCSDASLQGGYIAGAIIALYEEMPEIFDRIDVFSASSASVGNLLTYLSYGRENAGKQLWLEEFCAKGFVDERRVLSGPPLVDIDFLVDEIIHKNHPLITERILDCGIDIVFPIYRVSDGHLVIAHNIPERAGEPDTLYIGTHDVHELLRASMAVPVLYNRSVEIAGEAYLDAGMVKPIFVEDPALDGRKIIVLANRTRMSVKKRLTYSAFAVGAWLLGLFKARGLPWRVYRDIVFKGVAYDDFNEIVASRPGDFLIVEPSATLYGSMDNSPEAMKHNFDLGTRDLLAQKDTLRAFANPPG